jgi:hypothetical protein
MAGIDYTKTKGQDVWMWELYKNYGYVTFSARDFCSRLPLPTLCILTIALGTGIEEGCNTPFFSNRNILLPSSFPSKIKVITERLR